MLEDCSAITNYMAVQIMRWKQTSADVQCSWLHSQQPIPTHDMLPQHHVYRNELTFRRLMSTIVDVPHR